MTIWKCLDSARVGLNVWKCYVILEINNFEVTIGMLRVPRSIASEVLNL
jgi:hypothetical protein